MYPSRTKAASPSPYRILDDANPDAPRNAEHDQQIFKIRKLAIAQIGSTRAQTRTCEILELLVLVQPDLLKVADEHVGVSRPRVPEYEQRSRQRLEAQSHDRHERCQRDQVMLVDCRLYPHNEVAAFGTINVTA